MNLLPLYLRREPTADRLLTERNATAGAVDVVAYRDLECRNRAARWPYYVSRPDRRNRYVVLNCWRWRAVWLPDLESTQ